MSAPSATVTIEPLVNGKLVYLPMAPNTPNGKPQARLLVELTIANTSSVPLTAAQLMITFPSGPAGGSRTINQTVKPFSSIGWNLPTGADHYLFDLASAPTSAVVAVSFTGYSDPISSTLPGRRAHRPRHDRCVPLPLPGGRSGAGRVLADERLQPRPRQPPGVRLRHGSLGHRARAERAVLPAHQRRGPLRQVSPEQRLPRLRQARPGHGRRRGDRDREHLPRQPGTAVPRRSRRT